MIPAEAIEAAAKSAFRSVRGWGDLGDTHKAAALAQARAALEAAAPHMLANLRLELVELAREFDAAEGGTLAYTAVTEDGRFVMRKNAHDQLMCIVDSHMSSTP